MLKQIPEMIKLLDLLAKNGIDVDYKTIEWPVDLLSPSLEERADFVQLILKDGGSNWICDVICHPGSYGYEQGLLEIMAHEGYEQTVLGDDATGTVVGWLTAEKALEYFKRGWKAKNS